jgi:endonuclease/exonuclease/phosphatase family metal-dependent hydrolase
MRLPRIAPLVAVAAVAASCNGSKKDLTEVRVMTQNLWVGIELEPILGATSLADVPGLVQTAWTQKVSTDFTKRAGRIADAIQAAQPDLVGLQEVAQYFSGPSTLPATPATTDEGDFLEILLKELSDRHLAYQKVQVGTNVGVVTNADIQLPGTQGQDYRIRDREAVLVRSGLTVTAVRTGNYASELVLQLAGAIEFHYKRGWVAVDAVKDGKPFTFVSTHLEAFHPGIQGLQAHELLAMFPSTAATILVGDMNSDPRDAAWPSYGILVTPTTGYADAGAEVGAAAASCCYEPASSQSSKLSRRVDLVLHSRQFEAESAALEVEPYDASSGYWPSDHAGFAAVVGLE